VGIGGRKGSSSPARTSQTGECKKGGGGKAVRHTQRTPTRRVVEDGTKNLPESCPVGRTARETPTGPTRLPAIGGKKSWA